MVDHTGRDARNRLWGNMPSLVRFLVTLGVLAAIGYGAMVALVTFVEPREGDMTIRIPAERLQPPTQ